MRSWDVMAGGNNSIAIPTYGIVGAEGKEVAAAISMNYGSFMEAVLDLLIIAAAIFMVVKAINNSKKKEAEAPATPAPAQPQEVLLSEIRDLLKK